jgi:H+/Cl- antiporter ClcA
MQEYLGIEVAHGGEGAHRRGTRAVPESSEGSPSGALDNPNFAAAYFASVGTSLLFAVPAAAVIGMFKPAAAGAGMPEVIAFLNGNLQVRAYELSTLVLKTLGAICIVSSGLLTGFDGPMIHIGSMVAFLIVRRFFARFEKTSWMGMGTKSFGVTMKGSKMAHMETIRRMATAHEYEAVRDSELQKRTLDFATLGACAALAAAFRSPLAAVTFALEEAISHFDPTFIQRAMLVSLWAFVMVSFLNNISWFNPFSFSIFHNSSPFSNSFWLIQI